MATLDLSSLPTRKILEVTGWAHKMIAFQCTADDTFKPGMAVTQIGETAGSRDIAIPAADEAVIGFLVEEPDGDIDDYFEDDQSVNVAMLRGNHQIVTWAEANCGALYVGQQMYLSPSSGFAVPWTLTVAPSGDTYVTATMQTELDKVDLSQIQRLGTVAEYSANDASDARPFRLWLD